MSTGLGTVGALLRNWRQRRRLSQLDLALEADISSRHLSFVENGRAAPSREMLLRLAEPLEIPLRDRNLLLLAGGYAPIHQERPLGATDMAAAKTAVEAVLRGHEPFPALAMDRHWNLVATNAALYPLLTDVVPELLKPPVNVLRLSLDPLGLAPRIVNLGEWRHHLLTRLRSQADRSGDAVLEALHQELHAIPFRAGSTPSAPNAIAVPLTLSDPISGGTLSLLSTTTVFGTAADITLAELTLECFYPADEVTRQVFLRGNR